MNPNKLMQLEVLGKGIMKGAVHSLANPTYIRKLIRKLDPYEEGLPVYSLACDNEVINKSRQQIYPLANIISNVAINTPIILETANRVSNNEDLGLLLSGYLIANASSAIYETGRAFVKLGLRIVQKAKETYHLPTIEDKLDE